MVLNRRKSQGTVSLLYKKEELVLFPPIEAFVLHNFHLTILPFHRTIK
jgi:hypothetical protein